MDFGCPQCGRKVDLSKSACRRCGQRLTLGAVLLFYWQRFRGRVRRDAAIRCPACQRKVRISADHCPRCGEAMTVQMAVRTTLAPPRRWGRRGMALLTPPVRNWLWHGFKLCIQLAFLAGSATLLWRQLLAFQIELTWLLLARVALTTIFVAVFALLSFWIVPFPVLVALGRRPTPLVRLALVCNVLSLLFGLQTLVTEWWLQALVLAGGFAVLTLAAYVFARLLWPRVAEVRKVVEESQADAFELSKPQGRKASYE